MLTYNVKRMKLDSEGNCDNDYVKIDRDFKTSDYPPRHRMCSIFQGFQHAFDRTSREFTVEFRTPPDHAYTDWGRGALIMFTSKVERWSAEPILVEREYSLDIAADQFTSSRVWHFKADNPDNKLKFKVDELGSISCNPVGYLYTHPYIRMTNISDDRPSYRRPVYCGKLDEPGALRDLLTDRAPSYEWFLQKFGTYRLKMQFAVTGSAPALHSNCKKDPVTIFVEDVYTLIMPREIIKAKAKGLAIFVCRWIIRPKNPTKKLNYVIETLDVAYIERNISPTNSKNYEYVSIFPDYFSARKPKITGSMNGKMQVIDGSDADLRSATPAEQWTVVYYYRGHVGELEGLKVKFTTSD
ncbi:uncharacterized protein LOC141911083 [Tubulanus polymorphus]|uniref:uncharacterized protein LOC141911083 n=1 Tax=Tubulanus polymorphus TaxID=672921 RepID=UPI003DA29A04